MSVEFFSNSQHHLWERCRMKESFFWENLVEREISRRTLWDVSSLPGRPREISFSLAGSTTAWAVCIFRPISGPNGDLKTSLRVLYFHERSNPDADWRKRAPQVRNRFNHMKSQAARWGGDPRRLTRERERGVACWKNLKSLARAAMINGETKEEGKEKRRVKEKEEERWPLPLSHN